MAHPRPLQLPIVKQVTVSIVKQATVSIVEIVAIEVFNVVKQVRAVEPIAKPATVPTIHSKLTHQLLC